MFGLIGKTKLYIIIGILLLSIITAAAYYYKSSQNTIRILTANNSKLEIAVDTQKGAIKALKTSFTIQTTELLKLSEANKELQKDRNALNSIILGHDWERLSRAKPKLIEKRLNDGTKELFNDFTTITTD